MSLKCIWRERGEIAKAVFDQVRKPKDSYHVMVVMEATGDIFGEPMCKMNSGQGPTGRQLREAVRIHIEEADLLCDECCRDLAEMVDAFPDIKPKFVIGAQSRMANSIRTAYEQQLARAK